MRNLKTLRHSEYRATAPTETPLDRLIAEAEATLRSTYERRAIEEANCSIDTFLNALGVHLQVAKRDARSADWRARVRIYSAEDNYVDPLADSDPNKSTELPGDAIHRGLPSIANWMAELIAAYHGTVPLEADAGTIRRKLGTLRVQMSYRRNGTGVLRVQYEHDGCCYIARCDIIKADQVTTP